jgi:formylglycine-generating enzyme required for sulfatase activity
MKLILIPSGKFMMGSPETDKDHRKDEGPQHDVTISKPFYMGVYVVTQEQYGQIMGKNPSFFKGAQNPVECLTWDDAVEFCKKLSKKTGKAVSLPTEAQWEYACRAGSKTRFSYGNDDDKLGDYAWYNKNSGDKTHPVGQKKPNVWGLYDMHGNVCQWCSDWYADDYAKANKTDPTAPASGAGRVQRGGDCDNSPRFCRSASRSWSSPVYRYICGGVLGFRVVAAGAAGVE